MKRIYTVCCLYHRVDYDGFTSGAIVKMAYPHADLKGWAHNDPLPDVTDYDLVILVDITLPKEWMEANASKLIWIDHHVATIKAMGNLKIDGLRQAENCPKEDEVGACILTWKYFFPDIDIPLHIRYCGSYDIFNKTGKYADWDETWLYMLHLDQFGPAWDKNGDRSIELVNKSLELIHETKEQTMQRLAESEHLEFERAQREIELFEERATEFTYRGYKAYLLDTVGLKPQRPAALMRSHMDKESCIVFQKCFITDKGIKMSIRISETCDLVAHEIAAEYGGGGHPKAAGCDMTEEQLSKLL